MINLHTYEEFLNESYSRRFGNFQVGLAKEKIESHWLDELKDVPSGVEKMIEHFGKTPHKDILVILEKDNKNFDVVRTLTIKFGVLALFGLDTVYGRFCVINTNS